MVAEEYEISLVVECYYSSASELGLLGEQGGHQAPNPHSHFGVEVVENEFRDVIGGKPMPLDILLELHTGNLEDGEGALEVSDQHFPAVRKPDNNNVRVIEIPGILVDFLQPHPVPGVEIDVMEDHHQFPDHVVDLGGGLYLRCDQYLHGDGVIQDGIELVELFLFVLVHLLLVCDLFVFYCLWLLSLLFGQFLPLLSLL